MPHLKEVTLLPQQYPTGDHYPFNVAALRQTQSIRFSSQVTFFVGENGSGKTTLLEAIAKKCGIYIWRGDERQRAVVNPYEKTLYKYIKAEWTNGSVPGAFFSSQIFHGFSQIVDEWEAGNPGQIDYFGGKSLLMQSHGQSIMSYLGAIYKRTGLYLLDEPETALSPKTQLALLKLLKEINAAGLAGTAQFIIATHSPILMACPGSVIYSFDRAPVKAIAYEDTDHYRIYKEFMDDYKEYL